MCISDSHQEGKMMIEEQRRKLWLRGAPHVGAQATNTVPKPATFVG